MQPQVRKLTVIVLGLFLFSFIPTQTAQATQTINTVVTWTTDQTISEDIVIESGGHLTIASGVTITVECTAGAGGSNEIVVNTNGQLTADGVTFQGDGSAGCWGGIVVLSEDDQTVIENSVIRDGRWGVQIIHSSPTISNNEIYNLKGTDNTDPGGDGYNTYGIWANSSSDSTMPVIENNHIYAISGGEGAAGVDGADGSALGANGGDGGAGGDGGEAIGIKLTGAFTDALVQGNTIEYLTGGACGIGGDGGDGAAGVDAEVGYSNGGQGGGGGHGGDGGLPGVAYGISGEDTGNTRIIDNEIAYLTQPAACNGGNGGLGADGGQGRDGGAGGYGGRGGNGGQGGIANSEPIIGVTGIHIEHAEGAAVTHDTISGNSIHDLTAGDSGLSGSGGNGGRGGDGGDGSPTDGGDGGTSNDAGAGGDANNVGDGLSVAGILITNVGLTIESNTIYNLEAGDGQTGGNGGNGGTGGDGGTGGYNTATETYGNGGNGGEGGSPGNACQGGGGGYAYGISVWGEDELFVEMDVFNNDVWAVHAGEGGDGSTPGLGGDGGNGGDTLDPSEGTGGNGGDGYQGGYGWNGGRTGYGYLVSLFYTSSDIYNNTLVDVTSPEIGGAPSVATAGGTGGLGGNGGTPGNPGADGAVGGWNGEAGSGSRAFGLIKVYGSEGTNIFNNILYLTDSTPENTYAIGSDDTSCFLDYNTIFGWDEEVMGVTNGSNTVYEDPLFVSATDHTLQSGSPCIDAGTNTGAPSEDILGNPRPTDGDGNGTGTTDIGAFEADAPLILNFLPLLLK